jgi:hypothetical protein
MTKLHEWEVIHSVKVQDYGTCAMTRRLAVPGGWMYEVRAQWDERKPTLMSVPDPAAPHVRKVAAADDRIARALAAHDAAMATPSEWRGNDWMHHALSLIAILRGE